jgi:hypothetical protein
MNRSVAHARVIQVLRDIDSFGRMKVNLYHYTVSYADLEAAMRYAENEEDQSYICEKVNELAKNTSRGEIAAYWPLPIDIVSFSDLISNRGYRPMQAQ